MEIINIFHSSMSFVVGRTSAVEVFVTKDVAFWVESRVLAFLVWKLAVCGLWIMFWSWDIVMDVHT